MGKESLSTSFIVSVLLKWRLVAGLYAQPKDVRLECGPEEVSEDSCSSSIMQCFLKNSAEKQPKCSKNSAQTACPHTTYGKTVEEDGYPDPSPGAHLCWDSLVLVLKLQKQHIDIIICSEL